MKEPTRALCSCVLYFQNEDNLSQRLFQSSIEVSCFHLVFYCFCCIFVLSQLNFHSFIFREEKRNLFRNIITRGT